MIQFLLLSFFLSLIGLFNIIGIGQGLATKQFIFILIGFATFFLFKKIGRNFFSANSGFFYWIFIVLLVLTFIIGLEAKGSRRWIDLYFFNFQASEIFKVFFILFLAVFLVPVNKYANNLKIFIKSLFFFSLPALIIFKQPDLGNATVYFIVFLALILFSSLPKKYLLYLLFFLTIIMPIGWHFVKGYQKERIVSFFNPYVDTQGTAYNMTQAIITVGSGKFIGRGMGLGTQSRLLFLPENHTDFAFSSLIEQFGFIGGFVTIGLYFILSLFIVQKMISYFYKRDIQDRRIFLYILGFFTYFLFQIMVNIGMNLGIFPITGIALPFISYGGSSFIAFMIGLALIP